MPTTIPQAQRFYPPPMPTIRPSPRWATTQVRPGVQGPGAGFAMQPPFRQSAVRGAAPNVAGGAAQPGIRAMANRGIAGKITELQHNSNRMLEPSKNACLKLRSTRRPTTSCTLYWKRSTPRCDCCWCPTQRTSCPGSSSGLQVPGCSHAYNCSGNATAATCSSVRSSCRAHPRTRTIVGLSPCCCSSQRSKANAG